MGIYLWITSSYLWIVIMLSIFESNLNLPPYVEHNYGHFMASGGRDLRSRSTYAFKRKCVYRLGRVSSTYALLMNVEVQFILLYGNSETDRCQDLVAKEDCDKEIINGHCADGDDYLYKESRMKCRKSCGLC